jgi:hypothetical protein
LRASFGEDHRFVLDRRESGGALARIDIPFKLYEAPTSG